MMIKKQKKHILWAITLVTIMIGGTYLYHYNPQMCTYRYAFSYNHKDFEKVFSFYNEEAMIEKFTKEEIISVLEEQSKIHPKIKSKELTMIKDAESKKWFVKFPYKLQSIYVFTPTGAHVYVDQKKVAQSVMGRGVEVKNMLPGKHQIKIEYDNHAYLPYITEIDLPKEAKAESPYETHNIVIVAPVGTWVRVGKVFKQNLDKQVVFENMLPGQYDVSIFMGNKDIEVFSQKIQIDKDNTTIHVENIKGNEKVKENLQTFFTDFNIEYKEGIMKKDTLFLHKFLPEKVNEDVISDFKMWYIDQKDVKDAKSLMEVRDIYPISGNELKTSVLETVYLVNLEKDDDNREIEQQYRVVIEWDYRLVRSKSTWQIISREINQSIVAYKNEDGKWIKY